MKLRVQCQVAFGMERYYGAGRLSRTLLRVARKKSFTRADIDLLLDEGFEIETIPSFVPESDWDSWDAAKIGD